VAEFQAGEVVVPVIPSAKTFIRDLKKQIMGDAYKAAREIGAEIQRGIQDQIRDVRVSASADTAAASAQMATLGAAVDRVDGRTARVRADADTGAATSGLTAVETAASRVDGRTARLSVDADTGGATAGMSSVELAASRIDGRAVRVQVDADVGGALAGIGLVTAALATIPIAATAALGAGALGGALAAAGVGFAGLAAVAGPSLGRINEALQAQEAATKAAATATTGGAQAAAQAASQALTLASAEQRVTDAKRTAKQAEEDLTRARQAAKQALEDLNRAAAGAALDQESAELGLLEARQRLEEINADPKSTDLQRKRAELEVRQAEQRVKDAKDRAKDTAKAEKDANKAGIEGSDQVIAAKDKIRQANQRLRESEAQLRVTQLQANAATKAGSQAQSNLAYATSKLSPAAKTAAEQIGKFRDAYLAWQEKLEPSVLPAVTGGLRVVQALFKPLTPLIKGSAGALVGLGQSAEKALGGKFWTSFFKDLSTAAPTAITGLGKSIGNVVTGFAGIVKAFLPYVPAIVAGVVKITGQFAKWGKGLGESNGFQSFIKFARENVPKLVTLFGNIGSAIGSVVAALAPLGGGVLSALSGVASWVASLPPVVIQGIAVGIGAIVLGVKAWAVAQTILNVVLSKNPIGLIITLIAAVVGAILLAYNSSEDFRRVVDVVWKGVQDAISFAWNNVIKPVVEALVTFWKTVLGPALSHFWENVVKPAWASISAAISQAWTNHIQPALKAIWNFLTTVLGPKIVWFQTTIVGPVFAKLGEIIKGAWTNIIWPALKAFFGFIVNDLAPKVTWLWKNIIQPAFSTIGTIIKGAWDKVIKPTFDFLYKAIFETIPNGFKKGVSLIEGFWNGLKEVARKPVKFIVDTVYNNGIAAVWNAVAKTLKLPELPLLKFAKGGIYPGYTPGKDVGMAAVSGGEAIMRPEWTRAVGKDYVNSANAAARSGGVGGVARFLGVAGDPGFAGAFAGGGIIGNIQDFIAGGIKAGAERLLNPLVAQATSAMGGTPFGKMLTGIPKTMVAGVIKLFGEREEKYGGASQHAAVKFARAQIGKPYQWGATGPGTYDCSGLTMRSLQAAGLTNVPRVTYDQINYGKAVSSPLAGDLGFPHRGHVWLYSAKNKIIEAPYTGAHVREVAARGAMAIRRPSYDDGGYLMPGTSLVHNGTGRPEPVLTDRQWQDVQGGTRGGDGSLFTIEEFHATPEQSPFAIAKDLDFIMGQRRR
jgi:phage-related protein